MSPHWTVWEAIIHSFFSRPVLVRSASQSILKRHTETDVSNFCHILRVFFLSRSFQDGAIRYYLDLIFKCFQEGPKGLKDHTHIKCFKIIENIGIQNYVIVDYDFSMRDLNQRPRFNNENIKSCLQ